MALLVILTTTLTASATDFITDVMVAGHKNQSDFNTLIENLQQQGWTDINQDLNQGCGSNSDYIHLLYKKQSSSGNTGTPITGFYIKTGNDYTSSLTHEGRTYYLVPCDGSDSFVNGHGDLNNNAGGAYIHLYYTKDAFTNNHGVTSITFNTTQSGAVGENGGSTGYDLNTGCGSNSAYIYMHVSTTSGANVVTLCSGSGEVPLQNGHILTGTGGIHTHVTIADGATVTLSGVNITTIVNNDGFKWAGLTCLGNAVIVLNGNTTNSVKGGFRSSGIYVPQNKTLTIQGSGTLNATGNNWSAGIGSSYESSCGNITINGGNITANGGASGAGIGSSTDHSSCGNILISGGTVNATGGDDGAGIGSGEYGSSCGNITISGGTVTANGGGSAAGIGSGYEYSSCGNITISGGSVTVNGGYLAAGIGSGRNHSSCGTVTITDGVALVTVTTNNSNPTIGMGNDYSTCGTVTICGVTGFITESPYTLYTYTVSFDANGGTGTMANMRFINNVEQNLTANSFSRQDYYYVGWATTPDGPKVYNDGQSVSNLTDNPGATVTLYAKWIWFGTIPGELLLHDGDTLTGIGGVHTHVSIADGATVTFSGVDITTILEDDDHRWPGITCLGDAVIVLAEGTTNSVKGGFDRPGIYVPESKSLTLQGSGTLNVTGGGASAGIGGSYGSPGGNITISGGTVTAYGGDRGAGIGSGWYSSCGNITISSGTVTAYGGWGSAGIGTGFKSSCGTVTISGGTVTAYGGSLGGGIGSGNYSSCGTVTISGGIVTATSGLDAAGIGSGKTYSSCGNITISGGTVTASGGWKSAGIGSGYYYSSCGNITITNGVNRVTATKGDNCNNAIGKGNDNSTCGTVTIGGVETGFITQSPFVTFPYTVAFNANSGTGTMDDQSFMYNVAQNLTANSFTNSCHAFQGWANTADGPKAYDDGQSVSNLADTIATVTLYANWEALPYDTLPLAGYGTGNGGWHLIASPMGNSITPTEENGFLTNEYDLYRFNPNAELEWENWKVEGTDNYHFNLESGRGYLYANQAGTTLTFCGTPYTGNGEVPLLYDSTDERKCWNLVGNPFSCDATLDRTYYVMSSDGTAIDPEPIPATIPIPPFTAVFVKAVAAGDKAVFTPVTP